MMDSLWIPLFVTSLVMAGSGCVFWLLYDLTLNHLDRKER